MHAGKSPISGTALLLKSPFLFDVVFKPQPTFDVNAALGFLLPDIYEICFRLVYNPVIHVHVLAIQSYMYMHVYVIGAK